MHVQINLDRSDVIFLMKHLDALEKIRGELIKNSEIAKNEEDSLDKIFDDFKDFESFDKLSDFDDDEEFSCDSKKTQLYATDEDFWEFDDEFDDEFDENPVSSKKSKDTSTFAKTKAKKVPFSDLFNDDIDDILFKNIDPFKSLSE